MSNEFEKETVIIESIKNEESFERYKSKMIKIGAGIAIVFFLFYLILGGMSPDDMGLFMFTALWSSGLLVGIVYFIYWVTSLGYKNVSWIITNKGLTQINHKNGYKNFIPTNQISSVSHVKETVTVITIDANRPMSLAFLKNASELKKSLDDLIYKTEKRKEVVVIENKSQAEAPIPVEKINSTSKNTSIEEIKQFKELLDTGIITQEEFDKKKKELLGL